MRNVTLRDPAFLGGSLLSVISTPLFNFPFSGNRTLTDTVSGGSLITFSRAASTGTFFDSSGILQTAGANAARFTTNPLTLESLGLLGEESKANLSLWSNDISNSYWQRNQVTVTPNAIISPDNTQSAGKLIETAINSQHTLSSAVISWVGNTQYTFSVFAKIGERSIFDLLLGTAANWVNSERVAIFDATSGAIIASPNSPATASSVTIRNGWYRFSVTATTVASPGASAVFIRMYDNTPASSYLGIAGNGLHFSGIQVEAGSLTSIVSSASATATRNADVADITNANAALIAAIRTIFVEFRSPAVGTRGVLSLNDGTANNRIDIRTSGTAVQVVIVTGGVTQATLAAGTIAANARARLAVRLGTGSFSASLNGAAPVLATGTLPTVDRAAIARTQAGEYLNGTIATVTGWAQEFTDSMLVSQST